MSSGWSSRESLWNISTLTQLLNISRSLSWMATCSWSLIERWNKTKRNHRFIHTTQRNNSWELFVLCQHVFSQALSIILCTTLKRNCHAKQPTEFYSYRTSRTTDMYRANSFLMHLHTYTNMIQSLIGISVFRLFCLSRLQLGIHINDQLMLSFLTLAKFTFIWLITRHVRQIPKRVGDDVKD